MNPQVDTQRAYNELERPLRQFIARRVPACDVDDVLQDAFVRIQQALPNLKGQERLSAWAYRIAQSAVVENYRQRGRHPLASAESDRDGPPAIEDSNELSAIEQELAAYLVPTIAALPSPYREALTLTDVEGIPQKVAADALGISLAALKSRVQRGRTKLRAVIDACCRIATDARGRVIECEPRDCRDCRCGSE